MATHPVRDLSPSVKKNKKKFYLSLPVREVNTDIISRENYNSVRCRYPILSFYFKTSRLSI